MVRAILKEAGFVENVSFRETRFIKPPSGTFCTYMDTVEVDGSDDLNLIEYHNYTIDMYQDKPDTDKEIAVERALDARGVHFQKQARYWIDDAGLFQVTYDFEEVRKRGK